MGGGRLILTFILLCSYKKVICVQMNVTCIRAGEVNPGHVNTG